MQQTVKSKSGRVLAIPADDEDQAITAAAMTDVDNPPLTAEDMTRMKRVKTGRPLGSGTKRQVSLRLDVDLIERFKATGKGWQTRINDSLRDWVNHH
jgi:uncharacterized protein (DUF4415 family)